MKRKKPKQKSEEPSKKKGVVPYPVRVRIVQAVMRGNTHADAAVAFGVSTGVIQKFMALFQRGGIEALQPRAHDGGAATKRKKRAAMRVPREQVIDARKANPEWGTRRIRDVLARFEGLGVSEAEVRRILHEEGLITEREVIEPREKPVRRFERAEPNQLWQTDIFTFELRRHQRVYVVGFMDDYSRYLVSWAMAHHQKASLVIEALERGIADYGQPREVLTDQGRQYAAWRGKTAFQELLRRHGIEHCKSRPQHPETLGKIERFWKTLWEEFLRKTVFADFADGLRRIGLFIQHYNFQRPHQGIDGAVPADRFFRAAPHVRAAIETQIQVNALRIAQEKPPQKPFYLVGRLGDQDLSIAAAGGALRVQVGEASQTIPLSKETDDEAKTSRAFLEDEGQTTHQHERARGAPEPVAAARAAQPRQGISPQTLSLMEDADEAQASLDQAIEDGSPARTALAWNAAMAERAHGPGRGRTAEDDADPLGALWAYARDHGDCGAWDLPAALLPARDQRAGGDDAGADPRGERIGEPGRCDASAADRGVGGTRGAPRAGEPAPRAAAVSREEGTAGRAGGDAREAGAEAGPAIDERWARTFAWLEEIDDGSELADPDFDPDDGWRDDAVSWNRKLAGADAPTEGDLDAACTPPERTFELRDAADRAGGAAGTLRGDLRGAGRPADDQRSRGGAGDRAGEHADAGTPCGGGDPRDPSAEADGQDAEAGEPEAARGAGEAALEGEREAEDPAHGRGRHDDGGRGDHSGPAGTAPDIEELGESIVSTPEATAETEQRRGSGTSSEGRAGDRTPEELE